jgi:hypothetical protein
VAAENIGQLVPTKIPGYSDAADIQAALRVYHYGSYTYDPNETNASNLVNPSIAYTINNLQGQINAISAISPNVFNAKGDILSASADNTPAILSAGSNGQVLTLNSSTATGLQWSTPEVTLSNSATLTNKTLTSPIITGLTINDSSIVFEGSSADDFETTLTVANPTTDRTITLPNATTTLVGTDTSDTLTNKTITSSTITPIAGTTSTAANGAGYMGMPQNSTTTGAYRLVAADAGTHIYSTATRTITIPGNATGGSPQVAFPIGSTIVFVNASGVTLTIQMDGTSTDTCLLAGVGTSMTGGSGSRTLAAFGFATLLKITATSWIISGNGLT